MSDEALKAAVQALLCILDFNTEDAAHVIDASREALRQIRTQGGGVRTVYLTMVASSGHKLTLRSPEIGVSKIVHRRIGPDTHRRVGD